MRTFTANFLAQAARKDGARPYQILEIDWGDPTGKKYYLDRPNNSTSFHTQDNSRAPAVIENSLVVQWPSVGLSLKEGQVGATDQTSVVLNDADGALTAILNSKEQQRSLVTLWRLFDDASTVWPGDAAQIFNGVLRPFDWSAQNNQITLNLGDLGPLLAKDVSCIATNLIFSKLPQTSQDKNIPLCWGLTQRVEALPISVPWETKITQSFNSGNPITINIADHPDTMPGVTAETNYDATLGTDPVTVTFHQSPDENTTPSSATISVSAPQLIASAGASVLDDGTTPPGSEPTFITFVWYYYGTWPSKHELDLASILQADWPVTISDNAGGHYSTTLSSLDLIPGAPAPYYKAILQNIQVGVDPNPPHAPIYLWDIRAKLTILSFFPPTTSVNPWPTGTVLRSADTTYIYAISALPSKAVQRVEGFGSIDDASGTGRKDFVVLGQARTVGVIGSTVTTTYSDEFTVKLNDSSWNAGLGRDITTITFSKAPRDTRQNLDDNRIWCTVLGVDDAGNSTGNAITNPAKVVLEYLQNANLMNVAAASIDSASFAAAASALSGYIVGFPQMETRPGLQLLQEIATQCNSVLRFDQGKAGMVVISDTADTIRATFDTVANDNLLQGSLTTQESSVDDLVNEVIVKWTPFWDDITGKKPQDVRNYKVDAISAFGRISREIPIYLYWRRVDVETQRDWWLDHLSSIFRSVKFTTFLSALVLQPGDWISVQWIDGGGRDLFGGAKSMMVVKVTDTGKDGLVEIEARYALFTYAA